MPFRFCPPLTANPRMEDALKRAFFGRVRKDYRSQLGSIQVFFAWKDIAAKLGADLLFYFGKLEEHMRCLIGIEEFRGGKHLPQTFAKCAFAGGNPSGDPDSRHSSMD